MRIGMNVWSMHPHHLCRRCGRCLRHQIRSRAEDTRCQFAAHAAACIVDVYSRDFEFDDVDLGFSYLHRVGYLFVAI